MSYLECLLSYKVDKLKRQLSDLLRPRSNETNGGASFSPVTWSPDSITDEQFWGQMGFQAWQQNNNLPGVTSLIINQTTALQGWDIEACQDLQTFAAPNLVSLVLKATSENIYLIDNPNLVSISLPVLAVAKGVLRFADNPSLTTIDLSSLAQFDSTFNFSGNALTESTVNAMLALLVAATTDGSTPWVGTVNLSGGTSAAPTGQGILDAATLTDRGATVTTN